MDDILFPATLIFDDRSFRLVASKDDLQTDVAWSITQYALNDVLVDSKGEQYRLTSRNEAELVCDALLGCVDHESSSPERSLGYDLYTLCSLLKGLLQNATAKETQVIQVIIHALEVRIKQLV